MMRKNRIHWLYSLLLIASSLTMSSCDYDDADVMRPSSWAGIFVVVAVLLFFYYLIKLYRRK
ncbi:CcmD family protein [Pontibacter actiniarum]|uniref:Phosphatidate cytidylyltransferase n=1 Tax=Pontibacter actiniarum TaxID=323450 RepID=A0A1X9YNU9_9BACT|nr:hypothetical protein [Pontibacter actiniarum]ARS34542.1 hypothetical protein CA264_03285 [Pontibacter actiniarum]